MGLSFRIYMPRLCLRFAESLRNSCVNRFTRSPVVSPKYLGKSCLWSLYSEGKYPLYNHPVFQVALRHNYSVSQPVSSDPRVCSYIFYVLLTVHLCKNLVNKINFVHNLFLVYLSISTCFGRLCAHHQEIQLCFCDTWYLLFCVDDCLVLRSICSCIPDSHPHIITSTKCRKNTVVSSDDGHIVARNM